VIPRIGLGYDIHPFAGARVLVLGGETIPYPRGLAGHSDADALCHAISDALLGALALGDLGAHFPDTEPRWKNARSLELLKEVVAMVHERGWRVGNVDATIVTEMPKLAPHVPAIRANLADVLGIPLERVSVKATRPEKLGALGRNEGLAVQAIALVHPADEESR
jgi:2-C-methyl-D-erythritol 2,4-cyclodiphosphate synthase